MRLNALGFALMFAVVSFAATAFQNVSASDKLLDINEASEVQLAERLPGIGPAKAARIVQWREKNGAFTSVDQLQEVKGIGPKTVERLREHIRVGSNAAALAERAMANAEEEVIRADVRRIITNVRLAAEPGSVASLPSRAWYKRSALEIFRAH